MPMFVIIYIWPNLLNFIKIYQHYGHLCYIVFMIWAKTVIFVLFYNLQLIFINYCKFSLFSVCDVIYGNLIILSTWSTVFLNSDDFFFFFFFFHINIKLRSLYIHVDIFPFFILFVVYISYISWLICAYISWTTSFVWLSQDV